MAEASRQTDSIVQIIESLSSLPPSLEHQQWEKRSIYRVPTYVADLNPKAYRPQVVSFGPYHHNDVQLRPMEEHKHRALLHFVRRSQKPCEYFLESLRKVARDLEESYDALDPKWKEGDKFLELMITDGCFMLEIMRNAVGVGKNDYAPNDPIFSSHRLANLTPHIRRDMLMLENQLPMLVLERLVALERDGEEPEGYIPELILNFHAPNTYVYGMDRFLHVLDVCRKGLLTPEKKVQYGPESGGGPEAGGNDTIRSATELYEAGISFKKSHTRSLEHIFFGRGVLRLPAITVDDATESMFLNIMIFEGLHIGAGTEVTSYVTFMDNIINDERDVALLHEQGIIQNAIGSNKAVAMLFNSLCREVRLASNSSLDAVQKDIDTYCEKRHNKWRAYFNHTYFRNPWTILSLFAAIFLFALTALQTVYAMLGYY